MTTGNSLEDTAKHITNMIQGQLTEFCKSLDIKLVSSGAIITQKRDKVTHRFSKTWYIDANFKAEIEVEE